MGDLPGKLGSFLDIDKHPSSPLTATEAVSLHYCAGDVKLFERGHAERAPQVTGRSDQSI